MGRKFRNSERLNKKKIKGALAPQEVDMCSVSPEGTEEIIFSDLFYNTGYLPKSVHFK